MSGTVAIVGRPNVGKSTLFNALAGRQLAITDGTAGTTRDRLLTPVDWAGTRFDLLDTGGMGVVDAAAADASLASRIEAQIDRALDCADVLVLLADLREGLVPLDRAAADRVRRTGLPVVLAANKADRVEDDAAAADLAALGFGEAIPVSALHRRGLDDLVEALAAALPPERAHEEEPDALRVAVLGRRNAGKSTLVNALAGEERVIVDERPGTTRDAVDVRIEQKGQVYLLIDTAGLRKRRTAESAPEYKSYVRAERALRRAQAVVLLVDATVGVGRIETYIARLVLEAGLPVVLAVNKWDLSPEEAKTSEYEALLAEELPALGFAPVVFLAALHGRRIWTACRLARELYELASERVLTSKLNEALGAALERRPPPLRGGRGPGLRYVTQTGVRPPTFTVFGRRTEFVDETYVRFLTNEMARRLGLDEIPVRLVLRTGEARTRRRRRKNADSDGSRKRR